MYAVIRAGGKQYRVAPGDVIRVEKVDGQGPVEFPVLVVSPADGEIARPQQAHALGQVVGEGRGDKVLVFHFKRKKQYKKIFGHRQPFTAVRITEIAFDGQKFTAPELPRKAEKPKAEKPRGEEAAQAAAVEGAHAPKKAPAKKAKPAAEAKHAADAKHKAGPKAKAKESKASKGKKK